MHGRVPIVVPASLLVLVTSYHTRLLDGREMSTYVFPGADMLGHVSFVQDSPDDTPYKTFTLLKNSRTANHKEKLRFCFIKFLQTLESNYFDLYSKWSF